MTTPGLSNRLLCALFLLLFGSTHPGHEVPVASCAPDDQSCVVYDGCESQSPVWETIKELTREIVGAAGAGISIAAESANRLADTVRCLSDSAKLEEDIGNRPDDYVHSHFGRSELARRYFGVLKDVAEAAA